MRRIVLLHIVWICLLALACDRSDQSIPLNERKSYDEAPEVEIGDVHWTGSGEQSDRDVESVGGLLTRLVEMTFQQDFSALPEMVDRQEGLWVDLKAHRSYYQLRADLQNPRSYLRIAYLDTAGLRAMTGNPASLSVRDVLRTTRTLRADLYIDPAGSCEAKLQLVDAPDRSYYLNNPVFIRRDGEWFILRLF